MEALGAWGLWGLFVGSFLASTLLPFSSDALLVAALLTGGGVVEVVLYATAGNFLGGVTTYYIGYLGRWEWIERLGVTRERLERQQQSITRYGALIALLSWLPIVGDVVTVALGFYRVNFFRSAIYMFVGRAMRFICWAWLLG